MDAVDLITISREYGAGGSDVARALGQRLGWRVLDRDLVNLVAERLRCDAPTVEEMDEHPPTLSARFISTALLIRPPELLYPIDTAEFLDSDSIAQAARAIIEKAAESPPLIVVGHGAQCLFRNRPGALHVRLVAPIEDRVSRLVPHRADPATVATQARHMDEQRAAYVRRLFHTDVRDPLLYDLLINTRRVALDTVVDLIMAAIAARGQA
jgi:cytidylate kinase